MFRKLVDELKNKVSSKHRTYPSVREEYVFNSEDLEHLNQQNKKKIQDLKEDLFSVKKKEDNVVVPTVSEIFQKRDDKSSDINDNGSMETTEKEVIDISKSKIEEEDEELSKLEVVSLSEEKIEVKEDVLEEKKEVIDVKPKNSFIHLNPEHQKYVMEQWNEINSTEIDKDIIDGKDLLNHNYTITYADEAARYIHHIRKKYEVVICYLIGFNNEKNGIYDKTIFSSKVDEEWKFLGNYIKILEKIRNFRN